MNALTSLYPKLSKGGYIIIDDYGALAPCRQAVEDYRKSHNIREEMQMINYGSGIYWKRCN